MRLSVNAVRLPGCPRGVVVCNFMSDDGTTGVVLQLDPVHARATAHWLLLMAEDAELGIYPAAPLPAPQDDTG